jgi:dipeptidase
MIRVMTDLVAQYGYASGGESFSISDAGEAWIMEIIGKGKYEKGPCGWPGRSLTGM